jgi:C_GCAxxG_C_C family probable redox protein
MEKGNPLQELTPDSLKLRSGCAVILQRTGPSEFSGSTNEQDCLSTLRGASYATSEVNMTKDLALKIGTGFGGGIARQGEVCGAYSAGVMILGILHGSGINDSKSKTDQTYKKVKEFGKLFKENNKSLLCIEILDGCDIDTVEGREIYKKKDLANIKCTKCLTTVVHSLNYMLEGTKDDNQH